MGAAEKMKPPSADLAGRYTAAAMAAPGLTSDGARHVHELCLLMMGTMRFADEESYKMWAYMASDHRALAHEHKDTLLDNLKIIESCVVKIRGVISGKVEG